MPRRHWPLRPWTLQFFFPPPWLVRLVGVTVAMTVDFARRSLAKSKRRHARKKNPASGGGGGASTGGHKAGRERDVVVDVKARQNVKTKGKRKGMCHNAEFLAELRIADANRSLRLSRKAVEPQNAPASRRNDGGNELDDEDDEDMAMREEEEERVLPPPSFITEHVADVMAEQKRAARLTKAIASERERARTCLSLVLVRNAATAEELAKELGGVPYISSKTDDAQVDDIVRRFRSGVAPTLVTTFEHQRHAGVDLSAINVLALYDFPRSFARFEKLCAGAHEARAARLEEKWQARSKRGALGKKDVQPGGVACALRVFSLLCPGDAAAAAPLKAYLSHLDQPISENLASLANVAGQIGV